MELFSASPNFPFYCAFGTIVLVIGIILIENIKDNRKSGLVYKFLKRQLEQNKDHMITIDDNSIRNKLGIKVNKRMWSKVDALRFQ